MRFKTVKRPRIGSQIFAVLWSIITLFPLLFTLISSFKNNVEIYDTPFVLPETWRIDNYLAAIERGGMFRAIFNSFFLGVMSVLLVVIFASMAAYVATRNKGKQYKFLHNYLVAGIMIPIHCTFIPLVNMVSRINGNNNFLVLILIYVTFNLPLAFYLISGYMSEISVELEEAALIDGASEFRIFFEVMLPLSKPAIATSSILTFLAVYNDLMFATLFISKHELRTISLALNLFQTEFTVELGPIYASIVLAILPMMIIYIFFQEKIIAGLTAGAVKG